MGEFNQGVIVGQVFNADTGAPLSGSMVSMGSVVKKSQYQLRLYTASGSEVRSIVFPPAYTDANGYFSLVFQWDPSDIGDVMDSAGADLLSYGLTAWRQVDNLRVPTRMRGTLKLRLNGTRVAGTVGVATDTQGWALHFAKGIYSAVEKIRYGPLNMGKGLTTEMYYLVDVIPAFYAYAEAG